ncbi:MAG: hypothetical protein WC623_22490 [Pedobacter sp.]|uniref:hypothetical protein n=1 Tax=Pedobacter sp. TaxID=1411316 RepID=UPI003569A35F
MSNTIDEKATKIRAELYKQHDRMLSLTDANTVKAIIEFTLNRTMVDICYTCAQLYPTCHLPANCKHAYGEGNKNVIECDGYVKREEQ